MHVFFFFFFNDPATTEIYTLSLHDALPIWLRADLDQAAAGRELHRVVQQLVQGSDELLDKDRKSTRLNSSHSQISYAVFCLKKKKKKKSSRRYNQYTTTQSHDSQKPPLRPR